MSWVRYFQSEVCDIYVGRPSKYGNCYRLGPDGDRTEVILLYDRWLEHQPKLIAQICRDLRGKVLGCWCPQPFHCHAEILAAIANGWRLCLPLIMKNFNNEDV